MREEIKKSIIGFIENNERVLCLNGEWGVGKTHLIEEIRLEYEEKRKNEIKYTKLFGLKI